MCLQNINYAFYIYIMMEGSRNYRIRHNPILTQVQIMQLFFLSFRAIYRASAQYIEHAYFWYVEQKKRGKGFHYYIATSTAN